MANRCQRLRKLVSLVVNEKLKIGAVLDSDNWLRLIVNSSTVIKYLEG